MADGGNHRVAVNRNLRRPTWWMTVCPTAVDGVGMVRN